MVQRSFGVTNAAGVRITEKQASAAIEPAQLGTTSYTGILQKGPLGKMFRTKTKNEFGFRAGGRIPESLLPDACLARISNGNGAGDVWLQRITDGTEKKAMLELQTRRDTRSVVLKLYAGNAGRWAGRKQIIVDRYDSITANTLQLSTTGIPADLQEDELEGALVNFSAVPGKSFTVIANDALGMLIFDSDVDLVTEIGGSTDLLISVNLANGGNAVAVRIEPGTAKPATEIDLIVSFLEGNVLTEQKRFSNLSMNPTEGNYIEKVINDDSDSDFLITVDDINTGSVTADIRPSNYASKVIQLTATVLTARIWNVIASSVAGAIADLSSFVAGAKVIADTLNLSLIVAGARATGTYTFGGQPADAEAGVAGGVAFTWKTTVVDPLTEVEISAVDAVGSLENLVAFLNTQTPVFAEKFSDTVLNVYAANSGLAGNALALTSTASNVVASAATLLGGVDQMWLATSEKTNVTYPITTGIAVATYDDYTSSFILNETSRDSTKVFAMGDTIKIEIEPFETEALVGGYVRPKDSEYREKFEIISNDADSITVRAGSDMTVVSAVGETFNVAYNQQMSGGYDGVAGITDVTYTTAFDTGTSPLRSLRGKNLGLIKLATPGVNAVAVQKAGLAFAESQNWQYRVEVPANVVGESAAEAYLNEQVGRNDFAVVSFPSYGYITNPAGAGKKLISMTGSIQGVEAKIAKNYNGYHKASAGTDAILPDIIGLPNGLGDEIALDEEFLNPQGINVVKKVSGNFVLWGDRTFGLDTSFKFKHQREYVSHVENTFLENFDFIIFALNNIETQNQLISTFIQFFTPEFAKGAITGESLQDAVIIKIDEENNTTTTRANGDLNAEIAMRVVDTVERFIITVSKLGITESA